MLGSSSTSSARVTLLRSDIDAGPAVCAVSDCRSRVCGLGRGLGRLEREHDAGSPVPFGWGRNSIVPRCASTIPRAIDNPSPAPAVRERGRPVESNGERRCSGGQAGAVIADDDLDPAARKRPRADRHRACRAGCGCIALFSRLTNTCSSRSWSAQIDRRAVRCERDRRSTPVVGQAGDGCLENQVEFAPVELHPHQARLDR